MDRLQQKLNELYTLHYSRVNQTLDLDFIGPHHLRSFDLMYGELIRNLPQQSKVLDLGCGTGFLLRCLTEYKSIIPIGVDSAQTQVNIARNILPTLDIQCADGIAYLRQHPNTFDGIFCNDVVEHVPDEVLLDWIEVVVYALKPGGFFTCRTPNAANILASYSRYMDLTHQRSFTCTSIFQLLEVGGLENLRIIPVRSAHVLGASRLHLEWLFHKTIFVLTGRRMKSVFTINVVAVGFKPKS